MTLAASKTFSWSTTIRELTRSLEKDRLADKTAIVDNGTEALDYRYRLGELKIAREVIWIMA